MWWCRVTPYLKERDILLNPTPSTPNPKSLKTLKLDFEVARNKKSRILVLKGSFKEQGPPKELFKYEVLQNPVNPPNRH